MTLTQDTALTVAKMIQSQHGPHDALDHLDYIEFLTALRGELEDQIAGSVAVVRAHGVEWQHVANALGVSKQAAHKRWRS